MNERQAVIAALLQLGALPAGMELFPAANDEAWVLIKRVIDESDYYLLVIGGRYGSVDTEGLSYTEKEYDYATQAGLPVMAFLHGNPGKLAFENSEPDPAAREKLQQFRDKVQSAKHVKYWASSDDLAGKIALSYFSFVQSYPAVGWVRADAGDSPETLRKLTSSQEEIERLNKQLHSRTIEPPREAAGLADKDELLTVETTVRIKISNLGPKATISGSQKILRTSSISWNEILSALAPGMLDEANQHDLNERFTQAIHQVNHEKARIQVRRWLISDVSSDTYVDSEGDPGQPRFTIEIVSRNSDFETAVLQLEALGIIERGSKKRPVADRTVYWTLTPWGRTRLTRLRAVRAGKTRPPTKDELLLDLSNERLSDDIQPEMSDGDSKKTTRVRRSR